MAGVESKEAIAARLEVTRVALGYDTQAAFAAALGFTPQRWNNYESGRDRLTLNLALAICRKFPAVTLDWLYRGERGTLTGRFLDQIDAAQREIGRPTKKPRK